MLSRPVSAQGTSPSAPPVNDEYRLTAFPTHPLFGSFTGFGKLGYINNVDKQVTTYSLGWPGVIYKSERARWVEGWGGFIYEWNDVTDKSNTHEIRPFVGLKLYVPNSAHMNLFDFTRVEWRHITTDDTGATDKHLRIRRVRNAAQQSPLAGQDRLSAQ
jgi:hypothetical protein